MRAFDVIIVGGGHAGTEAASAAARRGARVALVTMEARRIGEMSCNPAIGGLGKGHLVREIDALDGLMARAADRAAIHHRMLNSSKGAAVRGPRVQADRRLYRDAVQQAIKDEPLITVVQGEVASLRLTGGKCVGVELVDGEALGGSAVVLTTGTFLGGRLFRGRERMTGGRIGEGAALPLAAQIRALPIRIGRLKTGTPPRLDGRTIDWAVLEEQRSDAQPWRMSFLEDSLAGPPQLSCAITRTNAATHDAVRAGLDDSPLFSGDIEGRGPRYCPSIEDKIHRFGDRDGHQIFLEPEGLDTPLVYPNGLSTSLSTEVQARMVASMPGLAAARIVTPGYAVEYDHLDPRALDDRLALPIVPGLFFAGQINGTTGYEEAAAQGLVAGANAAAHALGLVPLQLDRSISYIGVMIDDLVLQGVTEPYRMLTARAEFRLRLRADNAATRLTPLGLALGLVGEARRAQFAEREQRRAALAARMAEPLGASVLQAAGATIKDDGVKRGYAEWGRFPDVDATVAAQLFDCPEDDPVLEELLQDAAYAPYVARQQAEVQALRANEGIAIPIEIDFAEIGGLSAEMIERLSAARPRSLGAASRIRGMTPAGLAALLVASRRARA